MNAASLILIAAAALYTMHAADYDFAGDDAFISFVYASNLATGDGLVFNPGEYVWGYTSPLQTLLLGGLAFAGFDLVAVAPRLSVLWVCLTSVLVFQMLRRYLPDWLCLLVSVYLATAHNSVSALETKLLIGLQCGFLFLLVSERARSAALIGALSCLTRPDSVVLVAPSLLMTRGARRPSCLALFALPGLAWLAFAYLYYGDILPNSFHAKQGLTSLPAYLGHHFQQFTAIGLPQQLSFLTEWLWTSFDDSPVATIALFAALALSLLLNRRIRSCGPLLYALLVYPWVLLLGYGLIGSHKFHDWEIYSGLFFCQLATTVGLFSLIRLGMDRWPRLRGGMLVVTATLGIATCYFSAQSFLQRIEQAADFRGMGTRHATYKRISHWINMNVPVTATLSAMEVGTIGYYTNVHIIDVAGIITRGYLPEERMSHQLIARRFEPGYMIVEGDVPALRPSRDLVYQRVGHFPGEGFTTFSVLARK